MLPTLAILLLAAPSPRLHIELHDDPQGTPGEQCWRGDICLRHDLSAPASIEVTSKGNGHLTLLNLQIRIYDDHDDGDLFEPRLLDIWTPDLNGDGFADLLICGTTLVTHEQGATVLARRPAAQIYMYDPAHTRFVPVAGVSLGGTPLRGVSLAAPSDREVRRPSPVGKDTNILSGRETMPGHAAERRATHDHAGPPAPTSPSPPPPWATPASAATP